MRVKKMYARVNQQIFCWPGDDRLDIDYDGNRIVVPGVLETANSRNGFVFESARDAQGHFIPGTLVVTDVISTGSDSRRTRTLDVSAMCEYLMANRDDLFNRGFNIVGSVQEIEDAFEQGRPLWEESQDARARAVLATELERRRKFEAKGEPAPPREDEHNVIWAIAHLKNRAQRKPQTSVDEIRAALEGGFNGSGPEVKVPVVVAPAAPAKRLQSATEIYQEAIELGVTLTKPELVALLSNDGEQTQFVLEKIKAKREAAPPA